MLAAGEEPKKQPEGRGESKGKATRPWWKPSGSSHIVGAVWWDLVGAMQWDAVAGPWYDVMGDAW